MVLLVPVDLPNRRAYHRIENLPASPETSNRVNPVELLRHRLALRAGTDVPGTVRRLSDGASLSAENLWLLGCSAVLASIGLDVGSAAVVIGAMLISPLMGPILGIGLGMGITHRALLQRGLRELGFASLFVLGASAAYFLVSPLATPTTELVARTRPTLLDVGVAFFGGVAGIVAASRKLPSMAIPGVAIATALMPPLCTAGFGLATRNWSFFFGASYLYLLNAVFIALATFLVVRLLRFPHHVEVTDEARRRERRLVAAVAVVAILPSAWFLYDVAHRLREQRRITNFVQGEIEARGRVVPQWDQRRDHQGDFLRIFVVGKPIDSAVAESLQAAFPRYGLAGIRLQLIQSDLSSEDLERFQSQVQRDILRTVTTISASRDSATQARARQDSLRVVTAVRDLAAAFPEIAELTYAPQLDLLAPDSAGSPPAVLVRFAPRIRLAERQFILERSQALLRSRLGSDRLIVMAR
jgi:uncharacterized hydrophobic protein (TIGR00271 family)